MGDTFAGSVRDADRNISCTDSRAARDDEGGGWLKVVLSVSEIS